MRLFFGKVLKEQNLQKSVQRKLSGSIGSLFLVALLFLLFHYFTNKFSLNLM